MTAAATMAGGGAADENPAAADALAAGADASLNAFFDHAGLELVAAGGGQGSEEEEELEWLSNMDAFPSVETMAVEVEAAPSRPEAGVGRLEALPHVVGPRTKGLRRRRRVMAPWSLPPVLPPRPPPAGGGAAPRRRCTHCASEETPQWRQGPAGPSTLCNACGVRFKSGRLFPEYRPINSPTFSPLLHSNSHRRVLEMRHHVEEETAAGGGHAGASARRAERAAARAAAAGGK
ncbi:GATA transcription factor 1 [Dichanthelium oligosanthes]|uniref:GATA transcription factor 1 n=1 Tax=Dichanthelium oligosanthes TaxID=888268 RepID=A0A1E5W7U8_9POAL|nr:GATA transcription factor 1 [Dichanthelium oligosanthes]